MTTIEHMVKDRDDDTGEDDRTHLNETLRLHDFTRDVIPDSHSAWQQARQDNDRTRLLHHHVFTTRSLLELLTTGGFHVVEHTTRFPHDIYALCSVERSPGVTPEMPARIDSGPFSA